MSPFLFNIYIDDLLVELANNMAFPITFADDLTAAFQGKTHFYKIDNIIKRWSATNNMGVNVKKSALMFVSKKKFKQKKHSVKYPETNSYKHLGARINNKGSLAIHIKQTSSSMIITAVALSRVKNDTIEPRKLLQLYFTITKATLDYPGPILDNQKEGIKDKFRRIAYKTLRQILGLRKSSPIRILHQLCGDPADEWRRRKLYHSLGRELRNTDPEY